MKITIRKANLKDLPSVQNLNHDLFISDSSSDPLLNLNWPVEKDGEKYFRKMIIGEIGVCFVANNGEEVVGYLAGSINKETKYRPIISAEIENMLVKSDYRSKGIGADLANAFIEWCRNNKVVKVHVKAYYPNTRAIEFYKKVGFEPFVLDLEQSI